MMNGILSNDLLKFDFSDYSVIDILILVKDILLDIFMALGPSINYIFQAVKFNKTKSSHGFSCYLCLVTMMAHTTKIYYWFGERYKYTLLIQSILVNLILLYILYQCVEYREKKEKASSESLLNNKDNIPKSKTKECLCDFFFCRKTFNLKLFWRWDNIIEYYKFFVFILALLTGLLFGFGIENKIYADVLGYTNLILETLCSLPQIIEMYRTKNQRNISKRMILLWFCGNLIKIYYNYYNDSPLILIIGGYIQVYFNIILIGQIIYYYQKNRKESKESHDNNKDNTDNTKNNEDKESDTHLSIVSKSVVEETNEDLIVSNGNDVNKNEEIDDEEDNKKMDDVSNSDDISNSDELTNYEKI